METRLAPFVLALLVSGCAAPAALDEDAMLERFTTYATPGDGHDRLAPLAGRWDQRVRFWTVPGAEPESATMSADYAWTMEGRFLRGDLVGDIDGAPFRGLELIGYDAYRREYVSTWIDTMSTSFMTARGRFAPGTDRLELRGATDDVLRDRRDRPFRTETDLSDRDRIVHRLYAPGPDGREFLVLESTWVRSE